MLFAIPSVREAFFRIVRKPSANSPNSASEYVGNIIACRYACGSSVLEISFLPSELSFMNLWFCRLTVYVSTNTTSA
jgi:hypothetical protein